MTDMGWHRSTTNRDDASVTGCRVCSKSGNDSHWSGTKKRWRNSDNKPERFRRYAMVIRSSSVSCQSASEVHLQQCGNKCNKTAENGQRLDSTPLTRSWSLVRSASDRCRYVRSNVHFGPIWRAGCFNGVNVQLGKLITNTNNNTADDNDSSDSSTESNNAARRHTR
jgi:hypothetical protein